MPTGGRSCKLPSAYRAPVALILTGFTFALVGVVPLAITLCMGVKSSATVIGVGFIGFGTMFLIPGICWCIIVKHSRTTWWRRGKRQPGDDHLQTPALSDEKEREEQNHDGGSSYRKFRDDDDDDFDAIDSIHDDQQKLHRSTSPA